MMDERRWKKSWSADGWMIQKTGQISTEAEWNLTFLLFFSVTVFSGGAVVTWRSENKRFPESLWSVFCIDPTIFCMQHFVFCVSEFWSPASGDLIWTR